MFFLGHARIYKYISYSHWLQVGTDIVGAAANDNFGTSVSLSADGTIVAVGAPGNDANGVDSGEILLHCLDAFLYTIFEYTLHRKLRMYVYSPILTLIYFLHYQVTLECTKWICLQTGHK